jgi:hypothetical protein
MQHLELVPLAWSWVGQQASDTNTNIIRSSRDTVWAAQLVIVKVVR